jgi:hypothetical protein
MVVGVDLGVEVLVGRAPLPETCLCKICFGEQLFKNTAAALTPASFKKSLRDNVGCLLFCIIYGTEAVL